MVNPTLDFQQIETTLGRLDVVVFGPGIGRNKQMLVPLLEKVLEYVHETPNICLVIDADGIFLLGDCLSSIKKCKNAIVTPNHREFERLYQQVFGRNEIINNTNQQNIADQVKKLASHLGICILRKGDSDIITDGQQVLIGSQPGTLRRCGGQGDILSGATALFAYWSKLKAGCEEYSTEHILQGALAASDFIRFTSRLTFDRIGRSMNAADIIAQIPDVVRHIDQNIE
uniref:ATP-dependent NAD(P)H-hydrate dehydratase n=1 Tax=Ditylenchus dipsaci TaxID=166011 RepID=A0A915D7Z4_9BILA